MIWFFLLSNVINGQKVNFNSTLNSKFTTNTKINKIENILKSLEKNNKHDSLQVYFSKYSNWLYENKELKKAIFYRKKALSYSDTLHLKNQSTIQKETYDLGKYYRKDYQLKKAIVNLNKVLKINNNNEIAIKTYYQLGHAYNKGGNLRKAILYFEITINLLKNKNIDDRLLISSCINIAIISSNSGDYNSILKGIKYSLIADSIAKYTPISMRKKYSIKFNLAFQYNQYELLDIKKSFYYFNQALKIAQKQKDTFRITQTLRNMASLYNTTSFKKSNYYNKKAHKICNINDSLNLRELYFSFGLTYARNKEYRRSIDNNHKSLSYLLGENIVDFSSLNKNIIIKSKDKISLLFILPVLAETYLKLYEKTNKTIYLEKSIAYFKIVDYTLDLLKMNSYGFTSRLLWQKKSANIYGKAIKACYLNNNIEDAFYFMEKNKALLLMEDLVIQNHRQTLDISLKSLKKEYKLKQKLLLTNNYLENEKIKNKKDSLNKIILDTNRELLSFQDSIYINGKINEPVPKILSIKQVQQNLKVNEIFVEYYVSQDDGYGIYTNKENGYIIFLTKDKKFFFEINHLSKLKEEVSMLIKTFKAPFKTNQEHLEFNKLSHTIYKKLFPTQTIKDLIKNKKIKIATDSYLSLLPFETLITENSIIQELNKPNYLIKDCNISYLYSYSFLKNKETSKNNNKQFLGFAPISFNYDNLMTISNSKTEILNLKNYYKGDSYLNNNATKKTFLEKSGNYNIIHLATHANAQDSIQPWIAFYDQKLSLDELYLVKNKASLVVLSGCNTTLGKQEIGEGIMSLARGFFYGGSQSVMSSLWNVDDTATPYIMNQFYKNLSRGKTKSEALHLAKLNYLYNHSLSEASPHFWASFILLGEDNILETDRNFGFLIISLIVVFVMIFWFLRRKLTQKSD